MSYTFTKSQLVFSRAAKSIAGGVNGGIRKMEVPAPLYFERGSGLYFRDADGNHYLDFQSGRGALLYGHAPADMAAVIAAQARLGIHWAAPFSTLTGHGGAFRRRQSATSGLDRPDCRRHVVGLFQSAKSAGSPLRHHRGTLHRRPLHLYRCELHRVLDRHRRLYDPVIRARLCERQHHADPLPDLRRTLPGDELWYSQSLLNFHRRLHHLPRRAVCETHRSP